MGLRGGALRTGTFSFHFLEMVVVLFNKTRPAETELFLQPPPGKRYVRSFFFVRKIDAPFARIQLIPRTLLILCLSGLELRAMDAARPDLVMALCLWLICLGIFCVCGIHPRVARVYLLLSVPTLLSLLSTWLLFNPVPGRVTLLSARIYDGTLTFGLTIWQALWLAIVLLAFWRTRRLLGGVLLATVLTIVLSHIFALPTWTFARVPFFHALTVLISDRNLLIAVTKVVGYAGMVLATIALVVSSRDIELIGALRQLHLPPVVIFFLSTVFRTLDLSLMDYETIHQAQLARALNARPRSFIKRLRDLGSVAVPLVAVMIRRSSEIGDALISRGYRLNAPSTNFYETSPWRWPDFLTLLVCAGLLFLTFGPYVNLTLCVQRWV